MDETCLAKCNKKLQFFLQFLINIKSMHVWFFYLFKWHHNYTASQTVFENEIRKPNENKHEFLNQT